MRREALCNLAFTYYITAREQLRAKADSPPAVETLQDKIRRAFAAGIDYVQVREKDLSARCLARLVEQFAKLPEKKNSRLLVNERLDIAVSCGADGVHLPAGSLPVPVARRVGGGALILGVSCHNEDDAAQAADEGASYILLAPVFETPSKRGAKPLGLSALEKVCRSSSVPVYALGGVDAANAADCIRAGAAGVAGIRLFQDAPDLDQLCRHLRGIETARWKTPRIPGP